MRPPLELADVVRQHAAASLAEHGGSPEQRKVLRAIAHCRTAALGGHVEACDACTHRRIAYNSCRNRHCPKCQGGAQAAWLTERTAELLPVPYFHVVFTLPQAFAPLALQNPRVVYGLLFRAVSHTLREVAANPQHLGAEIGFLAVLHTWGQNLLLHPHVHCVVPAGGLSPDRARWVSGRAEFFLPVRVLSRVFRGKFIAFLKQAFARGALAFHGRLQPLAHVAAFTRLLNQAVRSDWVVYAQRPFAGPATALKYLARYTHRVAISNRRLVRLADGRVTFRWKDYADANREKTMTLDATEFLRRFRQHVLPAGFMRIRHYGFLANRFRDEKLALCRQLLHVPAAPAPSPVAADNGARPESLAACERNLTACTACGRGMMRMLFRFDPASDVRDVRSAGTVLRPVWNTS